MADEETPTPTTEEAMVPSKRLRQETERRQEAERKLADFAARMEALEDKDKTDIERLTKDLERAAKAREDAEKRAQALEQSVAQQAKRSVVAEAAAKLGFRNPADAALFVNLDEIEDSRAAELALKQVAKDKEYLLAPKTPEPKGLERVLAGGGAEPQQQRQVSPEELQKIRSAQAITQAFEKAGIPFKTAEE